MHCDDQEPLTCNICGNEEPRMLRREDWDQEYLNPHALEKFGNETIDDNLCRECSFFRNLQINTDQSADYQTRSQPYLLVTGIFLSPAIWVSFALLTNRKWLMLISIIAIALSTLIVIALLLGGCRKHPALFRCCCCLKKGQSQKDDAYGWFKGI